MTAARDHGGQPPIRATQASALAHARALAGVYLLSRSAPGAAAMEAAYRLMALHPGDHPHADALAEQWAMRARAASAME